MLSVSQYMIYGYSQSHYDKALMTEENMCHVFAFRPNMVLELEPHNWYKGCI